MLKSSKIEYTTILCDGVIVDIVKDNYKHKLIESSEILDYIKNNNCKHIVLIFTQNDNQLDLSSENNALINKWIEKFNMPIHSVVIAFSNNTGTMIRKSNINLYISFNSENNFCVKTGSIIENSSNLISMMIKASDGDDVAYEAIYNSRYSNKEYLKAIINDLEPISN